VDGGLPPAENRGHDDQVDGTQGNGEGDALADVLDRVVDRREHSIITQPW